MSATRPNILLLFTDQQRHDTIAALGNPIIKTPSLDRLAREGTAFTQAFTPSPVCMPARCALVTGLPPHRSGCVDNHGMPFHLPSFMRGLRDAGYQTHGVGKMHFDPDHRHPWGFESRDLSEEGHDDTDFHAHLEAAGYGHVLEANGLRGEYYYIPQPSQLPERLHETRWIGDRSVAFLERRDRSRPFFLWSSFIKPHPPFENPAPWNRLYRSAEMPAPHKPANFEEALCFWNHVQNRYKYRDGGDDTHLMRTLRAAYYGCISFVDQQIGRVLAALGDELDNTLVLFSSDHGELLGDYGCVGKRCMLDAACRIPLIARWPGRFVAGTRCDRPVTLLDVFPTFQKAAGVAAWRGCEEGDDLVSIADGRTGRDHVFSQFSTDHAGLYMITDGRWKYIYSAADKREWLYDRHTDPGESHNKAGNPLFLARHRRLRDTLLERFRRDGDTRAVDDHGWRDYGVTRLEGPRDYGLLFQDVPALAGRIAALGPGYARKVSPDGEDGVRLLLDCTPKG